MKTISSFALVSLAAICAGCATQQSAGRDYPGYKRIIVDGHAQYCYATGSGTERKAVCFTEAQVQLAQLRQAQRIENGTRPPTPNLDAQQAGLQLQQNAANLPGYAGPR